MTKRELSDDEKKFTQKNVSRNEEELSHIKLLVEYNQFMVDKMLYSNYLEKIKGYKKSIKDMKAEVVILEETINVGIDQIENGVEIKEEVKENVSMVEE